MKILSTLLLLLTTLLTYGQDTTYIDYLNRTYNSIPPEFIAVDTSTVKDDSTAINQLLSGPSETYRDTLENTYSSYYVEYTVNEIQGGTSGFLQIDTNSTQLSFTSLSTVTGIFIEDSLRLDSSSDLTFSLTATSATTALRVEGEIYHTTTYILVRLDRPSLDTVYFDLNTNQSVSASFASSYPVLRKKQDTTYMQDSSFNVRNAFPTFTHNIPSTYSNYIVEMELEHKQGGYAWDVDTNNTVLLSGPTTIIGSIIDTIIISGGSSIDYNISNVSNSGRYFVSSRILHTVDTVFINSMTTGIKEIDIDKSIRVYPNPTKDFLYINGYNDKRYELFDLTGRKLEDRRIDTRIDLREFDAGIYFLKINTFKFKILKK